MKTRTIAGDIRRIRKLLTAGETGAIIHKEYYGTFLQILDSIETKAARMQDALKPVLECDVTFRSGEEPWSVINGREIKTEAGPRIVTAVNHECAIGIAECHNAIYEACKEFGVFDEEVEDV